MTELDALDIALGLLTLDQVADKLSFAFPPDIPPALLINRMIARGDLPTVESGGKPWVKIEALREFMERTANVLSPTMVPLLWEKNPWVGYADRMEQGVRAELNRQLPGTLDDVLKWDGRRYYQDEVAAKITEYQRNGNSARLDAKMTPELREILTAPVPASGGVFQVPDASAFQNVGEIYLASQLQWIGRLLAQNGRTPTGIGPSAQRTGVEGLYESAASYKEMTGTAVGTMLSGDLSARRMVQVDDPAVRMTPPIEVTVVLSCATIIDVVGSNLLKLVRLAF